MTVAIISLCHLTRPYYQDTRIVEFPYNAISQEDCLDLVGLSLFVNVKFEEAPPLGHLNWSADSVLQP